MIYDAVVIGAGPAGSIAAFSLSRLGARVLLVERHSLGRDKPCGGGLTPRAWTDLEVRVDDLVALQSSRICIRAGGEREARLNLANKPVLLVRRRDFDRRLAEAALDAGAHLRLATTATHVEQNSRSAFVRTTSGETIRGDSLLVACGAEPRLGANVGLGNRRTRYAVAVELEAPMSSERFAPDELVFDYSVPGGYLWAFPKGAWWNVGAMSLRRDVAPTLRRRLHQFMNQHRLRPADPNVGPQHATGRRIPLWSQDFGSIAAGRVALIGDAAGLADPFFGEGIAQALESGRLAARAVVQLLEGRATSLEPYAAEWAKRTSRHARRMELLARVVYKAPGASLRVLAGFAPIRVAVARLTTESLVI